MFYYYREKCREKMKERKQNIPKPMMQNIERQIMALGDV